jgi:signal transduction histidine kinase
MGARLLGLLLGLLVVVLLALGAPLGMSMASARTQQMFLDRLSDTSRFASIAQLDRSVADNAVLAAELARYDEVYGIAVAVLGRDGRVLVSSRPGLDPASYGESAERRVRAALAGRHSDPAEPLLPWSVSPLVVAEPVVSSGDVVAVVLTASPTSEARLDIARSWSLLGVGELGALAGCVVLAWGLTRWVLRPVRELDATAHEIATGKMAARVPHDTGPPELRRLTASFNEMAGNVEALVERQRSFVADASHQLRNPLHALLLRLEAMALRAPPDWTGEVDAASEEGRHLARMLDELLELASAEKAAAKPRRVDLVPLIDQRVAAWSVAASAKQVTVRRIGTGWLEAVADPDLVGSALDVVVDNAVKFGPDGSAVTVAAYREDTAAVVAVRDEGPGLTPEELTRVGERFWRSRRHQNVDGFGLGLAIARTLLSHCGARLEFRPGSPSGLEVQLRFPAA